MRSVIGGSVVGYREDALQSLIDGLTTDGVFPKLDRLWVFAQPTESAALIDLVASAAATAVNSPTFTANRGYAGEDAGTPTKYIDTSYNPTTNGTNYIQDSAHVSAWCVTNTAATAGGCLMGASQNAGSADSYLFVTFTDGNTYLSINASGASSGSPGTRIGHWIASRTGSSTLATYQNGTNFTNPNTTSTAQMNRVFYALANNNETDGGVSRGNPNQVAMISMGGGLTSSEATSFYNRLRTYMTAVGVP